MFFSFLGVGLLLTFLEFFSFFEGLKVLTSSASLPVSPAALTRFAQA